jgi:ABC-type oligopeptide transport system substrate-binding subunit
VNEAQASAQLNHPNIVTIFDVGESNGTPFIVMEHVAGASLHEKPPASIPDLIHVASQVCAALEHAHAHNIVHRDLKPENILVADDGTAKLTDFGLALSLASRTTSEGAIAGTVFYLAPEQALGQPVDGRTDLYALGVILYELAAGRLPFIAEDPLAVVSQHLYTPLVLPSTYHDAIPPALESLILRLMAKQPDDRPASAADVRLALLAIDVSEKSPHAGQTTSLLDRIARGRLVGREDELRQARSLWQRAAAGQSQILLISGEPGVGKTRLSRELAAQAIVSGATVLVGECFADAGAPYAPVSQMIQQAVDGRGPAELGLPEFVLADLMTLAPPLRARHPQIPPNPPAEPQVEQQRISASVVFLMTSLSRVGPVLLLLEDAHWADSATLGLLRHLAHRAAQPDLRLLTVLTYREVELDEARALHETLLDMNRQGLASRIKLTRLTREQTKEMLAVLFQEEITAEFLDGIYRETEGNPFFIEEVCKALIEGGMLWREGGRWRRPRMVDMQVPQSIRVAIQSRLARLPEEAQEVLRRAAVLGREFEYDLLREVCDLDEEPLITALEAAERAQLVEPLRIPGDARAKSSPRFAFAHALIPHTLAESVSGLRRQRLHRRVAEALERLGADRLDELAPRIGRHFAEASAWDRAADYLLRAGDNAQSIYAYQEAIAAYEEALTILREQKDIEREARTLMKLGSLYHAVFDYPRSRTAYQEGFAVWQRAAPARVATSLAPASRPFRIPWGPALSFDPVYADDYSSGAFSSNLFAGLVERTVEMDILPDLARSWEVHEAGRTYIFHLRSDARWSDGEPVTARDFEVAWKRILDPVLASTSARILYDIKGARAFHRGELASPDAIGVRAVDSLTLRIDLESPSGYFLHVLATPAMCPIPAQVYEQHGDSWVDPAHLVTSGPFRVEVWHPNELAVLSRNPEYGGRYEGNLQRVELEMTDIEDWDDHLRRYERGELAVTGIVPWKVEEFRHRHADEYLAGPLARTEWVSLDTGSPPFHDRHVRQAFAHACDREGMVEQTLRGLDPPASGGLVPLGLPGHSPGIGLTFDPDRARQLLSEAGYPGGANFPEIKLLAPGLVGRPPHLEYLCRRWEEVLNVHVSLDLPDYQEYMRRMRARHQQLARAAWLADYPDPDNFLRVAVEFNGNLLWDEEYAELVEGAGRSTDQRQRMAMYQHADTLLVQEAAVMPLTYGQFHFLLKPWVRRYPASPMGDPFWKNIIID